MGGVMGLSLLMIGDSDYCRGRLVNPGSPVVGLVFLNVLHRLCRPTRLLGRQLGLTQNCVVAAVFLFVKTVHMPIHNR